MKTNQLAAFIAIAEGQGVAGAADLLCVSQPAITKTISNLENELGVPLFERSSNRLKLNQFGEILLLRAKSSRAELIRAKEEIELMKSRSQHSVKFNASPILIPRLIPKVINLFKQEHPHAHIELVGLLEDNPTNKVQALLDGEYDLLLTVLNENESNLGLRLEKLIDVGIIFIASKGHPALELKHPNLKELAQFNWIFPGIGGLPYQKLRAAFRRAHATFPSDVLAIANRQIIFSLLEEGIFLAAIPYHPRCFERDLNEFSRLHVDTEKIEWPIHMIRREDSIFSATMENFVDKIKRLALVSDIP